MKGEEGVPSEAGNIWLASGRGPAAGAQRKWEWPALANDNVSARVTLTLRIKSTEIVAPLRKVPPSPESSEFGKPSA
jgi:hypothetical protein